MQVVILRLIGWIEIYPVDSAIKPLNNQGLFWYKRNNIRSTFTVKSADDNSPLRTVLWVLKIDTKQTNEQTIRPTRGNPKQSLDSGLFNAVDSRFQVIDSGFPHSRFQLLEGYRIPLACEQAFPGHSGGGAGKGRSRTYLKDCFWLNGKAIGIVT